MSIRPLLGISCNSMQLVFFIFVLCLGILIMKLNVIKVIGGCLSDIICSKQTCVLIMLNDYSFIKFLRCKLVSTISEHTCENLFASNLCYDYVQVFVTHNT